MPIFFMCVILLIVSMPLFADGLVCSVESLSPVFVKAGNIYYVDDKGGSIQITNSRRDSSPVLSSNKKMIAFVRDGNQIIPDICDIDAKFGKEIWLYDFSTKKEKRLVKNNFECDKPKKRIVDPSNLLFSPDDKALYFITTAWTTSSAIHSVRIDTQKQRFIIDANDMKVVSKGDYKGYLLAYRHRYFVGGGTYDWYWLISPNGKEEGPLGDEITQDQMSFIESDF